MSYSTNKTFEELKTGDIVDIFNLRAMLHEGPLAKLFLARDRLSMEQVVLKVPAGDIINHPIILYHYQNEDRISRRISHPGIITYIHRQKSREYIIMAYAGGKDLRSMIGIGKSRIPPLDESIRLMTLLCDVIGYIHEQEIVHLDLKPENILCLEDGSIKLLDFGLATCRGLPDLLTADLNSPQGTPWYVSPEQLLGERRHPGCDIFSMGMIFYEMVTGHLPWPRSNSVRIARRRLSHDPTPPRYYNPDLPPQIQSIILRAISRQIDRRYPSAAQMAAELQNWRNLAVSAEDRASRRPPWWKRLWPGKSIQVKEMQTRRAGEKPAEGQLIGVIVNLSELDDVLAEVKKQALINAWEVTIVHIIEEEDDSELRRYGRAVEGEHLKSSLEQAVQLLRRCNIDPTIRLIKGDATQSLAGLCEKLNARMLVLGETYKKRGRFTRESQRERLERKCACGVKVAQKDHMDNMNELIQKPVHELTGPQLLSIDIRLVDLWYDHLHFHTDYIYRLLMDTAREVDLDESDCEFGRFLHLIKRNPDWRRIYAILDPIHRDFHKAARTMGDVPESDHSKLRQLYTRISLPLSCNLKDELSRVSRLLREQVDNPPPVLPFLADANCPVALPEISCYGPILKAVNLSRHLSALSGSAKGEA